MISRRSLLIGAGLIGAGLVGYRQLPSESIETGEPSIQYGSENCARCRMLISNPKFAGAWRQKDGREEHFDDIGCMVLLDSERHLGVDTQYWVHDFDSEEWIDAITATYVQSAEIHSPMNYGVAASREIGGLSVLQAITNRPASIDWNTLHKVVRDSRSA